MELTRAFKNLSKNDAGIAGGKGASLGEMTQAGIPVPPGFVVLADTFEQFLHATDLVQEIDAILDTVQHNEIHTVESASEKIQSLIKNASTPEDIKSAILKEFEELNTEFVAIRSSATAEDGQDHAWAGQLDSYLNIKKEHVLEKVQHCWASLFTPRAIFYRFEKGLDTTKISVAVVVQKMVNSEISGIAFSVHPVTEDRNQLIIEAGFGLGEAIVSGQITPDSYVVEKEPRNILDINVSEQSRGLFRKDGGDNEWRELGVQGKTQVLTETQINELSNIILTIENHYGFPCDIEWAFEEGIFYIVQSRPITTLSTLSNNQEKLKYNPKDYIRMFAGNSFSLLLTKLFMKYYAQKGVLAIQDKDVWITFFNKNVQKETLEEGRKLYTNKGLYNIYREEFYGYMEDSAERFKEILSTKDLNKDLVNEFFDLISKHWSYYTKTEFFYTDLLNLEDMIISIEEFDKLKLDGRSYLNKIVFEPEGYCMSLLKIISRHFDIPINDLLLYTPEEISNLYSSHNKIEADLLLKRTFFFISKKESLYKNEDNGLIDIFLSRYKEVSNIINGTIAYKGKVTAKARVFAPNYSDFGKIAKEVEMMEEGDILIAETTSPEIIQACKKASAIVTNQGGMLSHAAIVARELKIPCIIGMDKDVVRLIKTGDEVEVDANNGIVRIIK
jgi:phosphoenolpyruvate synthase/pyruvate phosphate dikinase